MSRTMVWAFGSLALLLGGCGGGGSGEAGGSTSAAPAKSGAPSATASQAPAATGTATAAPAMSATATAAASGSAGPGGLSTLPTQEEWAAAKEVGVRGSTALGCKTMMVREYLKIHCTGKNDTGGEPTFITVKKGAGMPGLFTFIGNGVTSLVVPYTEGIDVSADFSWANKTHTLALKWPRGSAMPAMLGDFGPGRANHE